MDRREVPVHYLRRNHAETSPPCVAVLAVGTRAIPNTEPEVQALACWAARFTDRADPEHGHRRDSQGQGYTASELADWIEQVMTGRKGVWLFAHDLAVALAVTRLPLVLADRGWSVTDAAVAGRAPWLRMRRGSKRLCVVDASSWLPVTVGKVAELVGVVDPERGPVKAKSWTLADRVGAERDAVSAAMLQLLEWWDDAQLGRFNVSGPACGWNAFRHLPGVQRVLVDPEPDHVRADRGALYGGRRGAWRVGRTGAGGVLELDITTAYPAVAAHLPLPVRRSVGLRDCGVDDWRVRSERWGLLAEVEVEVGAPRYPVRVAGRTWYPTGRFRTTLAGPEIAEAASRGELRAVGPGHVHQLGMAMRDWGRWVLELGSGQVAGAPPVAAVLGKHWGRTVIGKWSAHGWEKVKMGPSPVPGWGYEEGWDSAAGVRGGYVDIAGQRWWTSAGGQPENAYPAITAWVESHVRVRLSRVIDALGEQVMIQCDTDGMLVDTEKFDAWCRTLPFPGAERAAAGRTRAAGVEYLNTLCAPLSLRIKREHEWVEITGPQHVQLPGSRRMAGVARSLDRQSDGSFSGRTSPTLRRQMSDGDTRGYARPTVRAVVAPTLAPGWVLESGHVVPPVAFIDSDGATALRSWNWMPEADHLLLANAQHPVLQRILDSDPVSTFPLSHKGIPA